MDNFITERRAVFDTGKYFTECGWIFTEKSIGDRGVDAQVEIPLNKSGQIRFFSLQIKGRGSQFTKKGDCLTFYFPERHYTYWNAVIENHPLFIILQDNSSNLIYWQEYRQSNVSKTSKNWKLDIPTSNLLNSEARLRIMDIVYGNRNKRLTPVKGRTVQDDLVIGFSHLQKKNVSLYITLEYKNVIIYQDLFYKPRKDEWNKKAWVLSSESSYYYLMKDLSSYIQSSFKQTNRSLLSFYELRLKIKNIVKGDIKNVVEYLFDYKNRDNDIPKYIDFISAYELHTGLKAGQYKVKSFDYCIHFATEEGFFEVDCHEGLFALLKQLIDERSYNEIYTLTDAQIWCDIYFELGIMKYQFILMMQSELELYWKATYEEIEEAIGHTEHLDEMKEEMWREFRTFIDLYNTTTNAIEIAYSLNKTELYSIAVISMMKIYNPEICYDEYCEIEFHSSENEWESICLNEEKDDSPVFYIRPSEF